MSGPPPKPTALKVIAGNPGKRPSNKKDPQPRGNLYDAPDWLTADQGKRAAANLTALLKRDTIERKANKSEILLTEVSLNHNPCNQWSGQ